MGLGRMLGLFVMCLFITIQQTAAKSCVPTFDDCEDNTAKGKYYSGGVSTTKSGYTCKNWKKTKYSYLGNHNFCRNPSASSHAWCYTTSPRKYWEYCDIPKCDKTMEMEKMNITKEACIKTCKETTISYADCESKTGKGRTYAGTLSKTKSGRTCQKWTSQTPHEHTYKLSWDHNYCRNPSGGTHQPWCFTTDSTKRWEYCDVPICDKSLENLKKKKAYTTCINNPECEKCTTIIKKLLPILLQENIIQEGEVGVIVGSKLGASTGPKTWATTLTLIKGDDIITKRTNNELVTINGTKNYYVGKRYYGATSRRLTGLYAGPGDIVTITFPKEVVGKVDVSVGHTVIKMYFKLGCTVCKIGSPWGGIIILFVRGTSIKGEFTIKVDNAIKAATYVLGQTNNELWNQELKKYSPKWAELRVPGQVDIFVQTLKIKGITDMEATMSRIKETMDLLEDMIGLPPGSRPGAEIVDFVADSSGGNHYHICRPGWNACGDSLYTEEYTPKSTYYDDFFLKTGNNPRILHEMGHGYCYNDLTMGGQWVAENVEKYIDWKKGVVDEKYKIFMESPDLDFYLLHRMVAFDLFSYGKRCEEAKFNKKQLYEGAYDKCSKWLNWVPERIHGWDVWRAINTLNAKSTIKYKNNWDNMMDLYCQATKHNMLPLFNLYNIQPSNKTITSNCRKLPQSDILTKWLEIISCVKQSMMDGSKDIKDCSKMPNFPEHKGLCVISGVCHTDQAYGGNTTNMENKFDLYGSDKKKSSDNKQNCFKRAEDYFKDCKNDKEEKITAKFYGKELGNDDSFTYPKLFTNCECKTRQCQDYTGTLSKTKSGRTCQKWSSQTPHEHTYKVSWDHNYCRNPSAAKWHRPWCYTTDPTKEWEYCCY